MTSVQRTYCLVMDEGKRHRSAKEFLKEILANGSMEQAKIAEEAEERGIKRKHFGMRRRNYRLIL